MQNKIAVILNMASGSKTREQKIQHLRDIFTQNQIAGEFFLANLPEEIASRTKLALEKGFTTIVAAGGDGTVSAVAGQLLGSHATLGILPFGTVNNFAQDLKIPLNQQLAVKLLQNGKPVLLDVGRLNDYVFLNNCSIGIYPKIVRLRQKHVQKSGSKILAYYSSAVAVFSSLRMVRVSLQFGGQVMTRKTPLVFVGNNEYEVEGLRFGVRKKMDQGKLSMYLLKNTGKIKLLHLIFLAALGKLKNQEVFEQWLVDRVDLDVPKGFLPLALDGEIKILTTPLKFSILPKVLRVLVPTGQL